MANGNYTNLGTALSFYSRKITEALKHNLDKHKSNASHSLWQSIQCPVDVFGTTYTMTLSMDKYWRYVDEGRKAGKMPPIDAIIKWTSQKGIDIGQLSASKKVKIKSIKNRTIKKAVKQISNDSLRRQVAFLIARKIQKHGTKATHFYNEVMNDKLMADLSRDITAATRKDIIINITKK